jgi:uncharacterized protein (DUF1800 family)
MRSIICCFTLVALAACSHRPAAQIASGAPAPCVASAPAGEGREQAADQQVIHVLDRVAFGPRPGDVARVRQIGVDCWIAEQLQPESIDDPATTQLLASYETLAKSPAELLRDYPPPNALLQFRQRMRGDSAGGPTREDSMQYRAAQQRAQRVGAELSSARVARAVVSERQLQEAMVDFWENHFNIYIAKGQPERYFLGSFDRDVIRPNALGNFRTLLGAVAKSPAMLFYLDNWQSRADSGQRTFADDGLARRSAARPRALALPANRRPTGLNENYGRELLELHTLGVDGGYTQHDVIDVARALTGWTIRAPRVDGGFVFRADWHDAAPKVVLGHALPAGRGIEDGEEVLDIVARHPATAHFIALKLARRFVSDTPPAALVERAARTFMRTDGDIREVMRTILTSPEFFSLAAYRAKVKSPFEVVVSALRAVQAEPDTTARTALLIARLGEPLFGHQAPNGYPETGDAWMNTGAILNRINFGMAVAAGRIPGARADRWPLAAQLRNAPRAEQVDGVVLALLGGDVSPDTRAVLMSGANPLASRAAPTDSSGRTTMDTSPTDPRPATGPDILRPRRDGVAPMMNRLPELNGLSQIVGLALGAPEFQRR